MATAFAAQGGRAGVPQATCIWRAVVDLPPLSCCIAIQAIQAMVRQAMGYLDAAPDVETRVSLIKSLQAVTEGKVRVRAVLHEAGAIPHGRQCWLTGPAGPEWVLRGLPVAASSAAPVSPFGGALCLFVAADLCGDRARPPDQAPGQHGGGGGQGGRGRGHLAGGARGEQDGGAAGGVRKGREEGQPSAAPCRLNRQH